MGLTKSEASNVYIGRRPQPPLQYGLVRRAAERLCGSDKECATCLGMRCYFLRNENVDAVEELLGLSDVEAVAKARILFSQRSHLFEGFEVWDQARLIISYSRLIAKRSPRPVADPR